MFNKPKVVVPQRNPWASLFRGMATRRLFKFATGARIPRICRFKWTP